MSISFSIPLYQQIYQRYKEAIRQGQLLPGERVPAIRILASELNVARGTVEVAYQMLISEGYLESRGPAGTVVSPSLRDTLETVTPDVGLRINTDNFPLSRGKPLLPLQIGLPALDHFPHRLWSRLMMRNMRQQDDSMLCYPEVAGLAPLRGSIASYLGVSRGIQCRSEQIFICVGYKGCLDLICRTLMQSGDTIWFEDPGFHIARQQLIATGANLVPLPVDVDGLNIECGMQQAPSARFALVTPSHQSPLGCTLSLPRRLQLLQWARENQSWIIEDDYDSEFRYQGHPRPALKSLDQHGRVLYCGTFSKVLSPGLRLAYLLVPPGLVPLFMQSCQQFHAGSAYLLQAALYDFIQQGHFIRHLKKMRQLYAQRRQMMVSALQQFCGQQLTVSLQAGGMHLLVNLAKSEADSAVAQRVVKAGLAVEPLSNWCLQEKRPPALLLGFTNVINPGQANHLAQRLSRAIAGK